MHFRSKSRQLSMNVSKMLGIYIWQLPSGHSISNICCFSMLTKKLQRWLDAALSVLRHLNFNHEFIKPWAIIRHPLWLWYNCYINNSKTSKFILWGYNSRFPNNTRWNNLKSKLRIKDCWKNNTKTRWDCIQINKLIGIVGLFDAA